VLPLVIEKLPPLQKQAWKVFKEIVPSFEWAAFYFVVLPFCTVWWTEVLFPGTFGFNPFAR
jgi:hypothetical protein